uniref:Uncharacterized protein LOC112824280 n=1 Tax=Callorhinus ursinus TaxID=34884 RepID=A0A3Q7P2M8_CALUR|nr:uncharacterized protein LOC112824280 [Callorhinus ursinus]
MQKLVVIAARERSRAPPPPPEPLEGSSRATARRRELKISPPPSKVPTSPVSKKNPFVSRNRYKAGCPGLAALRASSQAGLGSFRLAHYLSRRIVYLQFGTVKGRKPKKTARAQIGPLLPLPPSLPAAPQPSPYLLFPYIAILRKAAAAKSERSRSASKEGAPWLAELEGVGGDVLAEAGKGRRGLRAVFFFFLTRCSEAGLGGPRVKWQAAESRSVSLSPRRSPPPPAPREQLQEPSARAARLQARRSGSNCCNRCCKFGNVASLCIFPRPAAPAPARAPPAPPPPPPPSSLPRARWLARGWRRWPLGRASCPSSRGAAAETTAPERRRRRVRRPGGGRTREPGSCGRPGPGALEPAPLPGLLLLPGSEEEEEEAAAAAAAARASSRLARSLRGAYTCVTDRAKSQLLPGSAADVSDPQPLGGRIVQAE